MMKQANILDLKSNAERLAGSNPATSIGNSVNRDRETHLQDPWHE